MFSLLCYIMLYYNVNTFMVHIYLPYIVNNYDVISNNNYIFDNKELYFLLNTTSYFMLFLYIVSLTYKLFFSKIYDMFSIGLMFIYLKHIFDIIICPNMTIMDYEITRGLMWVFTTPLMLQMYCHANNLSLYDINFYYHLITVIPNIFVTPFKYKPIYFVFTILFSVTSLLFLRRLYQHNQKPFTNLYIQIWLTFILINILDITQLCSPIFIHGLYNIADTLSKFICNIIISDYNEQKIIMCENMDLQSVQFISCVIKHINEFEKTNNKITCVCNKLIRSCKNDFIDKIPNTNNNLKLELLKKILPFDLDKTYIKHGGVGGVGEVGAISGDNKEFNFICVMFMDIVNYTELAKKYNGNTIFKLLNDVYCHFDTIIKKYKYLQKIETIGDAYMVVGDIYREELNYKIVVKEIILLGLEFIKEIKTIKTPDNVPLCIRIGINIGSVNVGILGNEIPRLCVVGNNVNVASRLQSTAYADTIQMSRHIYEHVEEIDFEYKFKFVIKENVFLKNIGSVTTYNIYPNDDKINNDENQS